MQEEDPENKQHVFRSIPVILKFCQWVLGITCIVFITTIYSCSRQHIFFFTMVITFTVGNSCLLLTSLYTGKAVISSEYEVFYNTLAAILLFAASFSLLLVLFKIEASEVGCGYQIYKSGPRWRNNMHVATSIFGLTNAALYCLDIFVTFQESSY